MKRNAIASKIDSALTVFGSAAVVCLFIEMIWFCARIKINQLIIFKSITMRTLLLTLTAILISIVIMISCTKEKSEATTPAAALSDEQLVGLVHWFMDAAKDVKEGKYLKSGEKMFLDSALYYIESSMNYKYSYTNEKFKDYYISEVNLTIPYLSAENKTYVINALDAFNLTLEKFRAIYQQLNLENKKYYMCSIRNGGATNDGDSIIINAKVYFGYGRRVTNISTSEVGYYWCELGGDCEGLGQYGAPEYLRDNYFSPVIYMPCPNPRIWWDQTDDFKFDQEISSFPNPFGGPIDNYCDYQLYYAISSVSEITPEVTCLSSESVNGAIQEIEYYRQQLQVLFDAKLVYLSKQFIDVDFETPDVTVNLIRTIRHTPTLYYGKIHYDCTATSAEPIPLMD